MSYFLLVLILLAICAWCVIKLHDIFNPAVITCISYVIALMAAGLGRGRWHSITNLSGSTVFLILLAISVLIGAVLLITAQNTCKWHEHSECILGKYDRLDNRVIAIIGFYIILIYYLYYLQINSFISSLGINGTLFEKLNTYRSLYIINDGSATGSGDGVSTVVLQLRNLVDVLVPFSVFEFNREFLYKHIVNIQLAIVSLIGMIASLLTTGRSLLISYIFSAVVSYLILQKHLKKSYSLSNLLKFIFAGCALIAAFFGLNNLMRRNSSFKFFDYFTFYLGSSITNLNSYMQKPGISQGTQTFNGFFDMLSKLGFPVKVNNRSVSWIEYSGNESNVFTALQRYYADGGYLTVILYILLFAITMSLLYILTHTDNPFWIILYSMTFSFMFDQSRDDEFYPYILRISFPIIIFFLYLLCKFCLKEKTCELQA